MNVNTLLETLNTAPETVAFADVIAVVDATYTFTPTAFKNGNTQNEAGSNNGSCKIFAFAKLQGLSPEQTLACFGDYYRKDVLENPAGDDHQNIRNFMVFGWDGVVFSGDALKA